MPVFAYSTETYLTLFKYLKTYRNQIWSDQAPVQPIVPIFVDHTSPYLESYKFLVFDLYEENKV